MATGLDGLLFTLTTTLIVARILAFPTQIDLPDNEYMVEDLGLYSGTKPKHTICIFRQDDGDAGDDDVSSNDNTDILSSL
jgi:hypothetical protein